MAKLVGVKSASVSRQELPTQVQSFGVSLDNREALLNERRRDAALRNLLLGSVAAGVAIFGYGRAAYAACTTVGTTMTCTGDLSGGVAASNPVTVLNVNSLTEDIKPPVNGGINFTSDGAITIVSDTGDFEIIVTGLHAGGIFASSSGNEAVSVTHTGDITSTVDVGIYARSNGGAVTTVSTGFIQAAASGIHASTDGAGAVSVNHTGDIASTFGRGIYATSDSGAITTVSVGDIQADYAGIRAYTTGAGDVNVTHTGDITSDTEQGIYAYSRDGTVTTVSSGDIQANYAGIHAATGGAADVNVTHTGDITSDTERGIYAHSNGGAVTTVSIGDIQANTEGILARTNGAAAVSVTHTGDIASDNDRGIYARSSGGAVTTDSTGDIRANEEGIRAFALGAGAVSVTHTGDITSDIDRGIEAFSDSGPVTTVSTGNIQAEFEGIAAISYGAGAVSVTHSGDITSDADRGIDVFSDSGPVTTVSAGTIQARNVGIFARSDGVGAVSVTHSGDITSDDSLGIEAFSDSGPVTTVSTGTIQAEDEGIYARSGGAGAVSVTHTGDITSDDGEGINATSDDGSVAITLAKGVVQGTYGAIETSSGTGTELTLNADSVLIGEIDIGGAGAAVLNTGPGLSIAHTFTGTVPTIGDVSGNVAVVSGDQIAVADISGLAFADNQLSATLDGVSGVLAMASHHKTRNWWISGFGGGAVASAGGNAAKTTHRYGGLVAGTFALLDNGVQLGVFAGAASGDHTTDISNGLSGNSTSYFAGVHGRFIKNLFSVDFAVTAGGSSHEGERIVANNTVATGLESASSSFDSFFIAPEITLSTAPINIMDFSFMPSVRIRYEAMRSDGFAETGLTSGAISTDGATSHAVNMRLQGAVPIDLGVSGTTLVARGGVDARFASFSGHDVTLMGVVTSDAGADDEFSTRGFVGLDFSHALTDHMALTASGEMRAGTTGYSATASLGLTGKF